MFAALHLTTDARTTLTISPRPAGILPGSLAGVAPVRGAACNNMEIFKDVVGYEGYYMVSNMGNVKSMERTVATWRGTRMVRARLLKPGIRPDSRLLVVLHVGGKDRTCLIHHLVAAAFIGPRPQGMQVCHNDGNPTNNAASNLRYDTPKGNHADKLLHGTSNRGTRNGSNKLTEAQVLAIRADTRSGTTVAAEYGITHYNVYLIRRRKIWGWLYN